MRPARVRVFDGLRVATEHIDHLQEALHSSIEDIRAVLGLGRVLLGFEVERTGDDAIVVQPGLAFDRRRERVLLTEPTEIPVAMVEGRDVQYVCVGHERVEQGEVEGRATLIWDSAAVTLLDTLPDIDDERVPIAKLVRTAATEGASFQIVGLTDGAEPTEPVEPVAPIEPVDAAAPPPSLALRQGVLRLAADAAADPLKAIAEALRSTLEHPDEPGEPDATLATADVPLDFSPAGVTIHSTLSATIALPDGSSSSGQVRAQGEITFGGTGPDQFGLSVARSGTTESAELRDDGVAWLPLAAEDGPEVLEHLHLALDVTRAAPTGFNVTCSLVWKGRVGTEHPDALEGLPSPPAWAAAVGWKAIGG